MLHPRISLKAKKIEGSRFNGWVDQHNSIVENYGLSSGTVSGNANAILGLAMGIANFCEYHDSANVNDIDYYVQDNVIQPLVDAFRDSLNLDLGGLDGGTLSGWIEGIAQAYELEG